METEMTYTKQIQQFDDRLARIEKAILGDDIHDQKGYKQRLAEVEDLAGSAKTKIDKIVWVCVGASAGTGGTTVAIVEIISKIIAG